MEAIPLCYSIEVYVFTSVTQQKSLAITNYNVVNAWQHVSAVLTAILGQLVVQIRYKNCAYDMGSHKVYVCSKSEIKRPIKY
jgi:hypothetical protein